MEYMFKLHPWQAFEYYRPIIQARKNNVIKTVVNTSKAELLNHRLLHIIIQECQHHYIIAVFHWHVIRLADELNISKGISGKQLNLRLHTLLWSRLEPFISYMFFIWSVFVRIETVMSARCKIYSILGIKAEINILWSHTITFPFVDYGAAPDFTSWWHHISSGFLALGEICLSWQMLIGQ